MGVLTAPYEAAHGVGLGPRGGTRHDLKSGDETPFCLHPSLIELVVGTWNETGFDRSAPGPACGLLVGRKSELGPINITAQIRLVEDDEVRRGGRGGRGPLTADRSSDRKDLRSTLGPRPRISVFPDFGNSLNVCTSQTAPRGLNPEAATGAEVRLWSNKGAEKSPPFHPEQPQIWQ